MTDTRNSSSVDEAAETRMTFGEHLDELRKRIMRSLFGAFFGVALCCVFMYKIFDLIARPYRIAAAAHGALDVFSSLKPQEVFMTYVTLAFQVGLIISSPWIIFQIWQFIAAGLYPRERKIIYRYLAPSCVLFLMGVAFFYFIVLPMTLSFFFSFTAHTAGPRPEPNWFEQYIIKVGGSLPEKAAATAPSATAAATQAAPMVIPELTADPGQVAPGSAMIYYNATEGRIKVKTSERVMTLMEIQQDSLFINQWRADDYLGFVSFSALIFGIAFEMPMVIFILARTDIVRVQTFRKTRKYAYFVILILAVFAAPSGDPMTLGVLFLPLIGLYELGIFVSAMVVKREAEEPEQFDTA
jgi:sec-independent protein translocase protein TatC